MTVFSPEFLAEGEIKRTREEIEADKKQIVAETFLEVLLDIRELLDKIETDTIAIRDKSSPLDVYGKDYSL